jgi:hypothetical protein
MVERAREGLWAAELPSPFAERADAIKAGTQLLAWNTRVFLVGDKPTHVYYGGKAKAEDVVAAWRRMSGAEEIEQLFASPEPVPEGGDPLPPPEPTPRQLTTQEVTGELTADTMIRDRDGITGGSGDVSLDVRTALDAPLAVIAAGPRRAGNVNEESEADGISQSRV